MPESHSRTRRYLAEAAVFGVVCVVAWYFISLRYQLNRPLPQVALNALADGMGPKPFQYRALVPWMAGAMSEWGLGSLVGWYRAIEMGALVGLFYSFRLLLSSYLRTGLTLLSFSAFYALTWNILLARDRPALLPYDLTAVLFMTLGTALIVRRQWPWYYAVFLLGALNRETILFCMVFFALVHWDQIPRKQLVAHLAAQVVIWVGVKMLMMWLYGGNHGQDFEYFHTSTQIPHWQTNLEMLVNWRQLIMIASSFGFAWLLLPIGWRQLREASLRRMILVLVPYGAVLIVLGNLNELRAYAEMLPFVLAPAIVIASRMLRLSDESA